MSSLSSWRAAHLPAATGMQLLKGQLDQPIFSVFTFL